jgi:hypothetical protein
LTGISQHDDPNHVFIKPKVVTPPPKNEKNNKFVSFETRIQFILIPTIEEYRAAGLADDLWYNKRDYYHFKLHANVDDADFMNTTNSSLRKQPFTKLYLNQFQEETALKNTQYNLVCSCSSSSSSSSSPVIKKAAPVVPVAKPKTKKTVSFDKRLMFILIPTRAEFREAGMVDLLWWTEQECASFKKNAVEEVVEFMKAHPLEDQTESERSQLETEMKMCAMSLHIPPVAIDSLRLIQLKPPTPGEN